MKIEFQANGIPIDSELRRFAQDVVESAFGDCKNQIERIRIRAGNVSEPRQDKSKNCQVQVCLCSRQVIIAEVMNSDIRVALHRAVDRARWTATRSLRLGRHRASNLLIVERHMAIDREPDYAA